MPVQIDQNELRDLIDNRQQIKGENLDFYLENQEKLQEEYGGEVIGIAGGSVVDHTEETEDLEAIQAFINRMQTEYTGVYVTKVPQPDESMML